MRGKRRKNRTTAVRNPRLKINKRAIKEWPCGTFLGMSLPSYEANSNSIGDLGGTTRHSALQFACESNLKCRIHRQSIDLCFCPLSEHSAVLILTGKTPHCMSATCRSHYGTHVNMWVSYVEQRIYHFQRRLWSRRLSKCEFNSTKPPESSQSWRIPSAPLLSSCKQTISGFNFGLKSKTARDIDDTKRYSLSCPSRLLI